MGSQLHLIFDVLQALTIDFSYGGIDYSVAAEDWTAPRAYFNGLPTRILAPLATNPDGNVNKISLGKRGSAEWMLADILILRDLESGRGIETDYPVLIHYMRAYTDTLLANRILINNATGRATVNDINLTVATFDYPTGGTNTYASVNAVLNIEEQFSYE